MIRWLALLMLTALASGCVDRQPNALGAPVEGPVSTIATVQHTNVNASVVFRGSMTEKCPAAGCWFILKDPTGTIKVDTRNAGFVVVDIPLNTVLLVAGRVTTNESERTIDATGLRRADAP